MKKGVGKISFPTPLSGAYSIFINSLYENASIVTILQQLQKILKKPCLFS